jgi:tRNA/tmRNA/rRNA uracil-C5-methylase (TrmA/RlmC/RlmD family)
VELERIDALFEGEDPRVAAVWIIDNAGTKAAPAGVRELDARGAAIHVLTGDLDNPGVPDGTPNEHVVIRVPKARSKTVHVKAKRVRNSPRAATPRVWPCRTTALSGTCTMMSRSD